MPNISTNRLSRKSVTGSKSISKHDEKTHVFDYVQIGYDM